ncbi:MAG: signal recognition particle protein Srp19 [Candidatus Bathyarchaeota archaeon]|nr:signal recognition particle protein Srp19 [Candidatus Bathyarchaeota archaeon]MCX8178050.1 signal recognition particle protein Srp19 [Candidatus Bathyarchaeota archaeon]MDW8194319.1 signal recognition particle subunit SRP19/SEC65 family protein [Nitrososphaerota archaeon]
MRRQNTLVLWPVYFDSTKSRGEGRKVPKNLATPAPNIIELKEAVEKLRLKYEVVPEASHPRIPWLKTGMLTVEKKDSKNKLMKKVAKQLLKLREGQQASKKT